MKRFEKWFVFFIMALLLALNAGAEGGAPLPALAVTVDDYVYGSERSTPRVSGNLEGGNERYFIRQYSESGGGEWREITQRPVSLGMPTEGGRYELKMTVAATDSYGGGSAICDFHVLPTDLDIGLSVKESIYFGDSCEEGGLFSLTDLLGRKYSVTFSERGKNFFTAAPPTSIGVYTLRVSVAASSNFNATEKTADFEIKKRSVGGELTLDDLTVIYGKEAVTPPLPKYTGKSELVKNALLALTPVTEYRPLGSEGLFSSETPTEVGEYEMRVSLGESKNLHAVAVSAVLRIIHSPISPSVSMSGWVYGDAPFEPRLTDGSNPGGGRVYYYYKPEGGEYTAEFPTEAGKYTLKVVIEAAAGYSGGECYTEFTVEKAERVDARLVFGDSKYGDRLPTPYVSGVHDGAEVSFSYSVRGKNVYSPQPPTESGEYTLRAEIAEGKNFTARTITYDFIIEKAEIYASVYVENRVYGDTGWTVAVSGNDGGGDYTVTYYKSTPSGYAPVPEDELTESRPFLAGDYKAVCRILESRNHKGAVTECKFTVERAQPRLSLTMESFTFYGKAPTPTVAGNTEGGDVSFIYYKKGQEMSSGGYDVGEVVTAPGEYTVAAVVSQTDNYRSATVTADFTVHKADLPLSAIALSVKSGGREVSEVVFGTEFELSLKNNLGYGAVSFFYQSGGGDFAPERPRAVGKYRVKAEIAATDVYKPLEIFFDLEIVKAQRHDVSLESGVAVYGEKLSSLALSGNSDEINADKLIFLYKPLDGDGEYVEEIPTAAGKYSVKTVLPETESYLSVELFATLTIEKAPSVITPTETVFVYNGSPVAFSAVLNHSEAELTVEGEMPVNVGKYTLSVSVPESTNHKAALSVIEITVVAAQGRITDLSVSDCIFSGSPVPSPVFNVIGDGEVVVEYYKDGILLGGAPAEVGEYTVRVLLSDGKNYKGCSAEKGFKITPVPVASTEGEGEPDPSGGGGGLWIAVIVAVALLSAVAAIALVRSKRNDGGDPPAPTDSDNVLPPGGGEAAGALNPAMPTGGETSDSPEVDDRKKRLGQGGIIERLTESGRIALDMWLKPSENESKEPVCKRRGRHAEVNLDTLCRHFEDGEVVDLESLKKKGLISKSCKRVKLLGRGEMTKSLDIRLDDYSKSVKESIEAVK